MTLDEIIKVEELLLKEALELGEKGEARVKEQVLGYFYELRDRRESELRPATKFLGNTPTDQWLHVISELGEATEELRSLIDDKDKEAFPHATEEIIDLQMSCETMLAVLGLDEQQRNEARRKVIAKNHARGYYLRWLTV